MKRIWLSALLGLAVFGVSLTAQEPKKAEEPKKVEAKKVEEPKKEVVSAESDSFYPLKENSVWTYKVAGGTITVKVQPNKVKVGDVECFRLETATNGKTSATEDVKIQADGIYRFALNGIKPDAPIKFFPMPAENGARWKVNSKVQGQEIVGEFVAKTQAVKVPAGEYKDALLIEAENFKIGGMETKMKAWYGKGVGVVKLEFMLGGQEAVLELEKYEAGK